MPNSAVKQTPQQQQQQQHGTTTTTTTDACYLHGVRDYEFGVSLRKIVEHNTLAVVGAWP